MFRLRLRRILLRAWRSESDLSDPPWLSQRRHTPQQESATCVQLRRLCNLSDTLEDIPQALHDDDNTHTRLGVDDDSLGQSSYTGSLDCLRAHEMYTLDYGTSGTLMPDETYERSPCRNQENPPEQPKAGDRDVPIDEIWVDAQPVSGWEEMSITVPVNFLAPRDVRPDDLTSCGATTSGTGLTGYEHSESDQNQMRQSKSIYGIHYNVPQPNNSVKEGYACRYAVCRNRDIYKEDKQSQQNEQFGHCSHRCTRTVYVDKCQSSHGQIPENKASVLADPRIEGNLKPKLGSCCRENHAHSSCMKNIRTARRTTNCKSQQKFYCHRKHPDSHASKLIPKEFEVHVQSLMDWLPGNPPETSSLEHMNWNGSASALSNSSSDAIANLDTAKILIIAQLIAQMRHRLVKIEKRAKRVYKRRRLHKHRNVPRKHDTRGKIRGSAQMRSKRARCPAVGATSCDCSLHKRKGGTDGWQHPIDGSHIRDSSVPTERDGCCDQSVCGARTSDGSGRNGMLQPECCMTEMSHKHPVMYNVFNIEINSGIPSDAKILQQHCKQRSKGKYCYRYYPYSKTFHGIRSERQNNQQQTWNKMIRPNRRLFTYPTGSTKTRLLKQFETQNPHTFDNYLRSRDQILSNGINSTKIKAQTRCCDFQQSTVTPDGCIPTAYCGDDHDPNWNIYENIEIYRHAPSLPQGDHGTVIRGTPVYTERAGRANASSRSGYARSHKVKQSHRRHSNLSDDISYAGRVHGNEGSQLDLSFETKGGRPTVSQSGKDLGKADTFEISDGSSKSNVYFGSDRQPDQSEITDNVHPEADCRTVSSVISNQRSSTKELPFPTSNSDQQSETHDINVMRHTKTLPSLLLHKEPSDILGRTCQPPSWWDLKSLDYLNVDDKYGFRRRPWARVVENPDLLGVPHFGLHRSLGRTEGENLVADEAPIRWTAAQLTSSHHDLCEPPYGPSLELLPVHHYDWNSLHFYPDIHEVSDVQLRGPHANIPRQRATPNWDKTKQEMMDMVRQNKADLKSMQSKPPVYSSSDEENVPPQVLSVPGDQWRLQPRPPVSTDSGSDTEGDSVKSSPKVWSKNSMHRRHVARDGRRASWAGPGTESPSGNSRKRVGGSSASLQERTHSPRQKRVGNVLASPRRERLREVRRHNSDIQEKYAKFEELQSRRRALESSSEEDISSPRNNRTVLQRKQSPQPVIKSYSTSIQKSVNHPMKSTFVNSTQYRESKELEQFGNVRDREQNDPSLVALNANKEISEHQTEEEVGEIGKDVFKQRLAKFEQMQQLRFPAQFRPVERQKMHAKSQNYSNQTSVLKDTNKVNNKRPSYPNPNYREPDIFVQHQMHESNHVNSQNASHPQKTIPAPHDMLGNTSLREQYYGISSGQHCGMSSPGKQGQTQELYNQILQQPCERVSNLQQFYESQQRLSRAFENKEIFDEALDNAFSDQQSIPAKRSPLKWLKQRQNMESQGIDQRGDPRQESRNSNRLSDDRNMNSEYYSHGCRKGAQVWRGEIKAIVDENSRRQYDTDLHTTPDSETYHRLNRSQHHKTMSSSFENIYNDVNLTPCSPSMNYPNGSRRLSYDMLDDRHNRKHEYECHDMLKGYPMRPQSAAELRQHSDDHLYQEQRPTKQHHVRHDLHGEYIAKAIVAEEQKKYEQYRADYERTYHKSAHTERTSDSWDQRLCGSHISPPSLGRGSSGEFPLHASPQDPPERDYGWPPFAPGDRASPGSHLKLRDQDDSWQHSKESVIQVNPSKEYNHPTGHEEAYQMRIFHMHQNAISGDPTRTDDSLFKTKPAQTEQNPDGKHCSKGKYGDSAKDDSPAIFQSAMPKLAGKETPSSFRAFPGNSSTNSGIFRPRSCNVPDSWDIAHAVPAEGTEELENCMYRGRKRSLTAGPELQRPCNLEASDEFNRDVGLRSDQGEVHEPTIKGSHKTEPLQKKSSVNRGSGSKDRRQPRPFQQQLDNWHEPSIGKPSPSGHPTNIIDSPLGSDIPAHVDPHLMRRRIPSAESSHKSDGPSQYQSETDPDARQKDPSRDSSHIPDSPSHPHPEAWDLERSVSSPIPFEIRDIKQLTSRYDSNLNRSVLKKGAEIVKKNTSNKTTIDPEHYNNVYNRHIHKHPFKFMPYVNDPKSSYESNKLPGHTYDNLPQSLPVDGAYHTSHPRYWPPPTQDQFVIKGKKNGRSHMGHPSSSANPSPHDPPVHDYENIKAPWYPKSTPAPEATYTQPHQVCVIPLKAQHSSKKSRDRPTPDVAMGKGVQGSSNCNQPDNAPSPETMFYIQGFPADSKLQPQSSSKVIEPKAGRPEHSISVEEDPYVDLVQIRHMKAKRLPTKEHGHDNTDLPLTDQYLSEQKPGSQSITFSNSGVRKNQFSEDPDRTGGSQARSPERTSRTVTPNTLEIEITTKANNAEKAVRGKWPLFRSRSHGDMWDRSEPSFADLRGIKAKLLSKQGSVAEKEAVLQELSKIREGRKDRLQNVKAKLYSSQDELIPIKACLELDKWTDKENVINDAACKGGRWKRRGKDDLTELERVFANLGINETEIQRPEIGRIRRLSVPNLRQLERQHTHEEPPNVEYLYHWLAEGSQMDAFVPSDVSRPQSEASEVTMSEFRSVSAFSDDSPADKVSPHRVTDDMALRRYRDSKGHRARTPNHTIVAYQYKSPGVTPATSLENLSRKLGRSKTPDPVEDDMATRQHSRKVSMEDTTSSLPLPSPTSTDYLVPRVTYPARGRMRIRPDVDADRYHDDMAYRRLRKDVPPIKVELPESYLKAYQEHFGPKIRSRSLEGPRNQLPEAKSMRERSSSMPGSPSHKTNMAKGEAHMVSFFNDPIQHAHSAPNLTHQSSVFRAKYDGEGNPIKIDPANRAHSPAKPKTTPRIVKQRHERRLKIRGLSNPVESRQQAVEESGKVLQSKPSSMTTNLVTTAISTPTYHLCPETTKAPWHSETKQGWSESQPNLLISSIGTSKSLTKVPLRVGSIKPDRPRPRSLEISFLPSAFFAQKATETPGYESPEYISQHACNTPESPSKSPTKLGSASSMAPSSLDTKPGRDGVVSPGRVASQVSPDEAKATQHADDINSNDNNNNSNVNLHKQHDTKKRAAGTMKTKQNFAPPSYESIDSISHSVKVERAFKSPQNTAPKPLTLKETKQSHKGTAKHQVSPISHIQKPSIPTEPTVSKTDSKPAESAPTLGHTSVPISVTREGKQDLAFEHLLSKHPSMQKQQNTQHDMERHNKTSSITRKKLLESTHKETVYKEEKSKEFKYELHRYEQGPTKQEKDRDYARSSQPIGDVYNEGFEVGDMLKEIVKSHGNALSFLDALERPTNNQGPESLTRHEQDNQANQQLSPQQSAGSISEIRGGRKITSSMQQECRVVAQQRTFVESIASGSNGEQLLGPTGWLSPAGPLSPVGLDSLDMLVASQPPMSADELDMSDYENNMLESDMDDRQTDILVERELASRKKIRTTSTRSYQTSMKQTKGVCRSDGCLYSSSSSEEDF